MWSTILPLLGSAIGGLWQAHREDTSIQRGVADARAAGVDPISALGMAGGAGSSANPFAGAVESYQRSEDRAEARRAALAAEDLNRRAVESQIELNRKQGEAMMLEATSRSIAQRRPTVVMNQDGTPVVPLHSGSDAEDWLPRYGNVVSDVKGVGNWLDESPESPFYWLNQSSKWLRDNVWGGGFQHGSRSYPGKGAGVRTQ